MRFIFFSLMLAVPAMAAWNLETVAWNAVAPRAATPHVQVAYRRVLGPGPGGTIVSRDLIAVAFEDTFAGRVKVATKLGDSPWEITQFHPSFGPAIAIDSTGGIHVAFLAQWNHPAITYAKKTAAGAGNCVDNSSYNCEILTVASGVNIPSLALTADGTPVVAFRNPLIAKAIVMKRESGSWTIYLNLSQFPSEDYLSDVQLRMKTDGWYYVFGVAENQGSPGLTWYVGPTAEWYWQPPDLAMPADSKFSVAVDQVDLPHYCYTGPSPVSTSVLRYASRGMLDWNVSSVWLDHATDCSIAIKADGKPGISFHDGYSTGLYYAETVGSLWGKEPVEVAGSVGYSSSLVFDNQNRPIIAYVDRTNHRIRLARRQ